MSPNALLKINNFTVFMHELLVAEIDRLKASVESLPPEKRPDSESFKLLNRLWDEIEKISQNPSHKRYRLGNALGENYTDWQRAKFNGQYRLFFRFSLEKKIIVLVWLNDKETKRAYGKKTDAYQVFKKMLDNGNPPAGLKELLEVMQTDEAS